MKITSIKQQVKRADRYSIFVDGKYSFSLSESELISSGVHSGQELTAQDHARFKETSRIDKMYGMLLRLVARRPRSQKELRDYLWRKKQDAETTNLLLNKLTNIGMLDDADFAKRWVESRRLLKPVSKRRLVQELKQKGIASDIIDQVLAEDDTSDSTSLAQLVERKRRQTRYQDDAKLMQYLARQGYGYDDIKQALSREDVDV